MKSLSEYLDEFSLLCQQNPGSIPDSLSLDFKQHKGHIVYAGLIHGDEVGSLPAFISYIHKLLNKQIIYHGKVTFILGNRLAALKNERFIDQDLNRSFGKKSTNPNLEQKRAAELEEILKHCDVFIDFHQTIQKTKKPFYIFAMDFNSYYWARACGGASTFITRKAKALFSSQGFCSDEYVRIYHKAAITIELSQKGFCTKAFTLSSLIIKRSLCNMDKVFLHHFSIKKLSKKNNDFEFLSVTHREIFSHPKKALNENLFNFFKVNTSIVLGQDEQNQSIQSPKCGYLLFPKYPKRNSNNEALSVLPKELFLIASNLTKHPLTWIKNKNYKTNLSQTAKTKRVIL